MSYNRGTMRAGRTDNSAVAVLASGRGMASRRYTRGLAPTGSTLQNHLGVTGVVTAGGTTSADLDKESCSSDQLQLQWHIGVHVLEELYRLLQPRGLLTANSATSKHVHPPCRARWDALPLTFTPTKVGWPSGPLPLKLPGRPPSLL
jgi:hypothetical protein